MLPDLVTLLLVRLGVDALIAVAFWAQMRRYPAIRGPGWWSLGAALSIVGTLGLMSRVGGAGVMASALAGMTLLGANVCAWLGLRAYLGMPMPWRSVAALVATETLVLLILGANGDVPSRHQLVYALSSMVLAMLVLRDLHQQRPSRPTPELRVLFGITLVELLAVTVVVASVIIRGRSLDNVAAAFLLVFLLLKVVRVMTYSALVSLRLRQEVEQTRQAVTDREAELRALVENLAAGVIVFRPDQSTVSANAAARHFMGWTDQDTGDAGATNWRYLLREDGQRMPLHEVPFERVLATGQAVANVVVGIRTGADESVRWALCNAYPENNPLGGLRHVVFTFVDITSLRQAQQQQRTLEQQLAQSQKMEALGTLAGGVAHDFNNILAAILGNADLARQDLEPGSPARESLHEISSAARRGRELVRQILAFSRQQPLERTAVCLHEIVNETSRLLRTAITPQIQLSVDVAAQTPSIRADATQLGQVLLNLGTNAIHALEGRPGQIGYRVEALHRSDARLPEDVARSCAEAGVDAVCVSVSDSGCGMSEATQKRMFEPFFTTKAVGHGTGLGLPVVLGIVQAHGGAIEVDSAPGQGTRFSLFFPAASEIGATPVHAGTMAGAVTHTHPSPAIPEETAMAEATSPAARHVLYLDDDDTLVFLVRRLLERRGYKVSAFTDQQQAIDAVRADPGAYHLLMTDYNMPGMSGIDVARAVRAISPQLPVAVASGYISDELQSEAVAAGVTEVVFKTDAVEAFCEIVARLVSPSRPA